MEHSLELKNFLNSLKEDLPSFEDADFSNISWCNHEGENALPIEVIRTAYGAPLLPIVAYDTIPRWSKSCHQLTGVESCTQRKPFTSFFHCGR